MTIMNQESKYVFHIYNITSLWPSIIVLHSQTQIKLEISSIFFLQKEIHIEKINHKSLEKLIFVSHYGLKLIYNESVNIFTLTTYLASNLPYLPHY